MKTAHTLLSFTLLGAAANGATIVQTKNYSFTPTGNQTLTFNEFDTLGGTRTLLSVTVTTSLTKSGGSLFVDNDSAVSAEGSISQTVTINLSATGASLYNSTLDGAIGQGVTSTTNYFVALAADDGDGAGYHETGPDWGGTAFAENTVTQTESVDNINTYIGSGTTFTVKVSGIQYTDTSSISGVAGAFTAATASGYVTVTYNYVPEPGSWLLVCGGLGAGVFVRRRRA